MADDPSTEPELDVNSLSFEQAYQRLGELAKSLDAGGLTLAEAIARYEQGMVLVRHCNQLLDATELKITSLKDAYSHAGNGQGPDDQEAGEPPLDELPF